MADYGEAVYIETAVQVIPVIAVVILADQFLSRDTSERVHRINASTAVAVGLVFGVAGEVAGFQALLTGPTRQTIPLVSGALMALGATAVLPRLAELTFHNRPDAARRFAQRLLPVAIGGVGLISSSWSASICAKIVLYSMIAISAATAIYEAIRQAAKDSTQSSVAQSQSTPETGTSMEGRDVEPMLVDTPPTTQPPEIAPNRWRIAALIGVVGASIITNRLRRRGARAGAKRKPLT
ncbi:hypothetical protein COUCH_34170 [Couchioplanes caeruleus]|uniref:hypothetical protein n=1 Tax=Couchioplanes caeruleus TaxID=56438 RepID=UPI0020C02B0E|nr:hypothetical protein [Couchioplanes caeruleus]UQU63970.1 hypothetical protein COUCH_34170 [Couchioplanes caeruleus]